MPDAIVLDGLQKRYGDTAALNGLDLTVSEASVVGLLGPNGAGKTTAIRILATLLRPDGGRATIFGADVERESRKVRASIGLTGQFSAVDEILTGAENLRMVGRLYRLSGPVARARADDLLAAFDLSEAAGRQVKTYSGGMRRRLDLAASLMVRPRLLMLDEPTSGLDSPSRQALWDVIRQLPRAGTTVLLTTQYLEEADQLADSIAVIDHGKLVATGTPTELKAQVGGELLEFVLADRADTDKAAEAIAGYGGQAAPSGHDAAVVTVDVTGKGLDDLPDMLLALREKSVRIVDVAVRRPTLDTVFLRLTGHAVGSGDEDTDKQHTDRKRSGRKRPAKKDGTTSGTAKARRGSTDDTAQRSARGRIGAAAGKAKEG